MLPQLTARILTEWPRLFPDGAATPRAIRYLGVLGAPDGMTTAFIAFPEPGSAPAFVVKVARDANAKEAIEREGDALCRFETVAGIIARSVPQVLWCGPVAGTWALAESALPGRPITVAAGKDELAHAKAGARRIELARRWLEDLHAHTSSQGATAVEAERARLEAAVDRFLVEFGAEPREEDFAEHLKGRIADLVQAGLVLRHGDYCPQNVLLSTARGATQVYVVDWAFSRPAALPLHDLFFFVSIYTQSARPDSTVSGFLRAFEHAFFGHGPFARLVLAQLAAYCRRLGIPLDSIRDRFGVFLIEQAVFEHGKVARAVGEGWSAGFTGMALPETGGPSSLPPRVGMWGQFFQMYVEKHDQCLAF